MVLRSASSKEAAVWPGIFMLLLAASAICDALSLACPYKSWAALFTWSAADFPESSEQAVTASRQTADTAKIDMVIRENRMGALYPPVHLPKRLLPTRH